MPQTKPTSEQVTFLAAGSGASQRTVLDKLRDVVSVKDFGAVGDGVADDTAAINAAIATNKAVYFPPGTYMTSGISLSYSATNPRVLYGDDYLNTSIKRISGTDPIVNVAQFTHVRLENLTFDGNNTGGYGIIWRAHYSLIHRCRVSNCQNYGMLISGSNVSKMDYVTVQNCYGGMRMENTADPLPVDPVYSCMYTTFENVFLEWSGGASGYSALRLAGNQCQSLTFQDLQLETTNSFTTKITTPAIDIQPSNCSHLYFYKLQAELPYGNDIAMVRVNSATSDSVRFIGGRLFIGGNGGAGTWNAPAFAFTSVDGGTVADMSIIGLDQAGTVTATSMMTMTGCKNMVVRDNLISLKEPNVLINDAPPSVTTEFLFTANNTVPPKMIGASATDAAPVAAINNMTFGSVTISDDGFFDIFGNGGSNSPGRNIACLITLYSGTSSTPNVNSFAMFLAQSSNLSGPAAHQTVTVLAGSNVELTTLGSGVACSLTATTDGKLGVQVGGGTAAARAIRVYNRLGSTQIVSIDIKWMNLVP